MSKAKSMKSRFSEVASKVRHLNVHLHVLSTFLSVAVIITILSFTTKHKVVRASEPTMEIVTAGDTGFYSHRVDSAAKGVDSSIAGAASTDSASINRNLPAPFPSVKGGWSQVDPYDTKMASTLAATIPHRSEIVTAAQETRLGYELDPQMRGDHGHGYGIFQLDDQRRGGNPGRDLTLLEEVAKDAMFAARYAASMLRQSLDKHNGNVATALQEYNAGDPTAQGAPRKWPDAKLYYSNSTLRYYKYLLMGMA